MITIQGIAADIARELRANPKAWVKLNRHVYRNAGVLGTTLMLCPEVKKSDIVASCLSGHICMRLYNEDSTMHRWHVMGQEIGFLDYLRAINNRFDRIIKKLYPQYKHSIGGTVIYFNDSASTNIEDIIKVCDEVAKS